MRAAASFCSLHTNAVLESSIFFLNTLDFFSLCRMVICVRLDILLVESAVDLATSFPALVFCGEKPRAGRLLTLIFRQGKAATPLCPFSFSCSTGLPACLPVRPMLKDQSLPGHAPGLGQDFFGSPRSLRQKINW